MKARTRNISKALATSVVVVGIVLLGLVASTALSATKDSGVTPPEVSSTAQVVGAKASAQAIAVGKVTILADMKIKADVPTTSNRCFWTKKGQRWWNGGYGANGTRYQQERVPGKLCPSHRSPTGWVKVAGGHTGRRCFNAAKVARRAPGPVVKGKVVWVGSLVQVRIRLHAKAHVKVVAACGNAEATAEAETVTKLRAWVRSKGAVLSQFSAKIVEKATAKASASIKCEVIPPVTTTTPGTTVTVPTTTTTTTTVPTTTTTPQSPPSIVNVTMINDVDSGGTSPNFNVTASMPGSNSGTLIISSMYGSFTPTGTFTVSGITTKSVTYVAPTEVPPGGRDTITVTLRDNTTGLSATPISQSFPINPPPVRPG